MKYDCCVHCDTDYKKVHSLPCSECHEHEEGYLISHYRTKSEVESAKLDRITRIVEAEEREAAIAGRLPSVPTVFLRNALRDEA